MPTAGNVVRIFISTTFEDMHSERDVLAREVFPGLRETFRPRGIHVVGVDLRWGVEEERDEDPGIVLDEIDRCRPFFVGILGERYGRAASGPEEAGTGLSLNAMEIFHGVLDHPEMKETSFFYVRDPDFSAHVPSSKRREVLPESEDADRKLEEIKERIRRLYADLPGNLFETYPCSFAGFEIDWRRHRGLLEHRLAAEDFALIAEEAETEGRVSAKSLALLGEDALSLLAEHSIVRLSNLDEFSTRIRRDLQGAIEGKFPLNRKYDIRPQTQLFLDMKHDLRPQEIVDRIERLEEEHGKETVKTAFSLIACSEEGLYEDELSTLATGIAAPLPPMTWVKMYRGVTEYLRDGGKEGVIEFREQNFKEEVFRRYIPDEKTERKIYSAMAKHSYALYLAMSSTDEEEMPLIGMVRYTGVYCLRAANKNRIFDLIASLLSLPEERFARYKIIFDLATEMLSSTVPEDDSIFYPSLVAVVDVFIETRKDREKLALLSEFLYAEASESTKKGKPAWGKAFAAIARKAVEAALRVKAKKSSRIDSASLRALKDRILEKI